MDRVLLGAVVLVASVSARAQVVTTVAPGALTLSTTLLSGCLPASGKVTLTAPAPPAGMTVALSSDNVNATVPAQVMFNAGLLSKSFSVKTTAVADTETATITAVGAAWTRSIVLTLKPMVPKKITLLPNPVAGGMGVDGIVVLECAAGPGDVVVTLSSNKPAAAMPTPAVTVPLGATQAPFALTTGSVGKRATASIKATTKGGTMAKTLTVIPG